MTEKKTLKLSKTLSADVLKKARTKFDLDRSNTLTFDVKSSQSGSADKATTEKLTDLEVKRRMTALKTSMREENLLKQKHNRTPVFKDYPVADELTKTRDKADSSVKSDRESILKQDSITAPISAPSEYRPASSRPVRFGEKQKIDSGTLKRQGKMAVSFAVDVRREKLKSLTGNKSESGKSFRGRRAQSNTFIVREVELGESITVQDLASQMSLKSSDVIKALMNLGLNVTINQSVDADTAEIIINEFGHKFKRTSNIQLIDEILKRSLDDSGVLITKPPVVTVMGHVDHGKTSLLDAFRKSDMAKSESGGITQHIGAYQVQVSGGKKITFIDTPGHEAFTSMRSRGANFTDIVVLVVAADDGVKPQTIEAINHAKAANVPIVVAINKIDKPGADSTRVKQELLQHGIAVEGFGGDILAVEISAKNNTNIVALEEAILFMAEVLDLKASVDRGAEGSIIEAKLLKGLGIMATVLINKGSLTKGDFFVSGKVFGKVRSLMNDKGEIISSALPGTPVEVIGFEKSPVPGDDFIVLEDENRAKEVASIRATKFRESLNAVSAKNLKESVLLKIENTVLKELNVIIKADVHGSIEALIGAIVKLSNNEVTVKVIHSGVGEVNENDIVLAKASGALVIGFNVRANAKVRERSKSEGINLSYYSIIYDVVDCVKSLVEGMLSPEIKETFIGTAEVRNIFNITKFGKVAGCIVKDGLIRKDALVRVIRDNTVMYESGIRTLRRFTEDVKEVRDGYEFGLGLSSHQDIQIGDVIECFERKEIKKKL